MIHFYPNSFMNYKNWLKYFEPIFWAILGKSVPIIDPNYMGNQDLVVYNGQLLLNDSGYCRRSMRCWSRPVEIWHRAEGKNKSASWWCWPAAAVWVVAMSEHTTCHTVTGGQVVLHLPHLPPTINTNRQHSFKSKNIYTLKYFAKCQPNDLSLDID